MEVQGAEGKLSSGARSELASAGLLGCNRQLGQFLKRGAEERETVSPRGCKGQGVWNLFGEGEEIEEGEAGDGKVSVAAEAVGEGVELPLLVLGRKAHVSGEELAGMEAGEAEMIFGLFGGESSGFVELADGAGAVEEGEDVREGREDVGVVVEGHFDGDTVCNQLEVVVG